MQITRVHLRLLCLAVGLCLSQAQAQSTSGLNKPLATPAPVEPRVEHIRLEDNSVRIDEVRVGGQTQHITVQPKNMPPYELGTHSSNRNPATDHSDSGTGGARGWKVLGF